MPILSPWREGYRIDPEDIPANKTYKDLLKGLGDGIRPNNKFIEINLFPMSQMDLDEEDYQMFWDCMKLYDAYGLNFYCAYLRLLDGSYDYFPEGIEAWFKAPDDWVRHTTSTFLELVKVLHFFCISSYDGISISDFDSAAANVDSIYRRAVADEMEKAKEKSLAAAKQSVARYFNFDGFSTATFNELFQRFTRANNDHSVSIDEAMIMAQQMPLQLYVTIFKKNGRIFYISKTTRLLQHIGDVRKRTNADSVRFGPVDPEYVDDILIALKVFYDLPLDKIRPSVKNRKYGTVNRAIFAYKRAESIPKKRIMAIINKGLLRVVDLGNGQEMIDKIELHRALFPLSEA